MFPSVKSSQDLLLNGNHPFFYRMSDADLRVRGSKTMSAYKQKYVSSLLEFTHDEKEILVKMTIEIDKLCQTKGYNNILKCPWTFVKMSKEIEGGFPHTLGKMIFLPSNFLVSRSRDNQMCTLLHEKIHVYQRIHPFFTNLLILNHWNFFIHGFKEHFPSVRNNPDTNNIIYQRNGQVCVYTYNLQNEGYGEMSLANVKKCNNEKYEHPFEMIDRKSVV